jgi:signal transduction histidine kinase
VNAALAVAGWALAIGGLAIATIARYRSFDYTEAVAHACHELRGPLAAVRLGLDLALRSGQLPDERLRALDLELARAALALDDLSDASLRTPRLSPSHPGSRERIDLAQLLTDSVEALRGEAAARGVEVRLQSPGSTAVVSGERLRLAQATGNLIANAIEHGGGVVEVSWRVDPSTIRIEVVDGGGGLPAPVAELARAGRLHRRSWQRGGVLHRRRASVRRGHGLAIASSVAAAHGGHLAAAPSERGARLVLALPRAEPTPISTSAGG